MFINIFSPAPFSFYSSFYEKSVREIKKAEESRRETEAKKPAIRPSSTTTLVGCRLLCEHAPRVSPSSHLLLFPLLYLSSWSQQHDSVPTHSAWFPFPLLHERKPEKKKKPWKPWLPRRPAVQFVPDPSRGRHEFPLNACFLSTQGIESGGLHSSPRSPIPRAGGRSPSMSPMLYDLLRHIRARLRVLGVRLRRRSSVPAPSNAPIRSSAVRCIPCDHSPLLVCFQPSNPSATSASLCVHHSFKSPTCSVSSVMIPRMELVQCTCEPI